MPVSSQQERTTSTTHATTPEQSTPLLPSQQEFHQYLRLLTQSAVRTVIDKCSIDNEFNKVVATLESQVQRASL